MAISSSPSFHFFLSYFSLRSFISFRLFLFPSAPCDTYRRRAERRSCHPAAGGTSSPGARGDVDGGGAALVFLLSLQWPHENQRITVVLSGARSRIRVHRQEQFSIHSLESRMRRKENSNGLPLSNVCRKMVHPGYQLSIALYAVFILLTE